MTHARDIKSFLFVEFYRFLASVVFNVPSRLLSVFSQDLFLVVETDGTLLLSISQVVNLSAELRYFIISTA